MQSIYFEDKVINFAAEAPADAILFAFPPDDITKVLQKLEIIKTGWVVSPDHERFFNDFCEKFEVRAAVGGVVENPAGELLMILRNGRWDLPKGHRETDETPRQCAEREIFEECGIKAKTENFLCTTCHTYLLGNRWILKQCDWFKMHSTDTRPPTPQTEEGITHAQWITPKELTQKLKNTFQTVKNVIEIYLK